MSYPFGPYHQYARPPFPQPPWNQPPQPLAYPRYLPQPNFPPDARPPNLALNIVATLGIWLLFMLVAVVVSPVFDGLDTANSDRGTVSVAPQQTDP